jgi:hypothetical protein
MRIDARRTLIGLLIAGVAGAALLLPGIYWVGSFLAPSFPVPVATGVPPLLAEAIWARANGGRATELQPFNPFTIGRVMSCHALVELREEPAELDRKHDECMALLPGLEGIGYLANVHMQGEGVWQDPRVPFVSIATITRVTGTWTKAELIDTLAARGEFTSHFIGADHAARGLFGRSPSDLTVPQAALLASVLGNRRADPWCDPAAAAAMRRRMLERMRDNLAIDEAQFEAASKSDLGLLRPPAVHKPCAD